uniref:Uncharacterized protein n=1 Tax=Salmonella sp. TaxID=599 RepID=A0A482EW70_SALSP|nr:hypothetical protein NNIBIDOC_00203 [Salmonella sp.]
MAICLSQVGTGMRLIFAHSQHQNYTAIAGLLANTQYRSVTSRRRQQPQLMRHEKAPADRGITLHPIITDYISRR